MNKFILFLGGIVMITSCGIKQINKKQRFTNTITIKELIERVNTTQNIPESIIIEGKINLIKEALPIPLGIKIAIKKDSLLWSSIRGPLGIELFRIQISTDSIYFLNRSEKTFFIKNISHIEKYLGANMEFNQIQEIITGTPKIITGRYFFNSNNNYKSIKSETHQYTIDEKNYKIISTINFDSKQNKKIEYILSQHTEIEEYSIPKKLVFTLLAKESFAVELNYKKISINENLKLKFEIPNNYVEKK